MKAYKILCLLLTALLLLCACGETSETSQSGETSSAPEESVTEKAPVYGEITEYRLVSKEDSDPDDGKVDFLRYARYVGGHTLLVEEQSGVDNQGFYSGRDLYLYDLRTGKKSELSELPKNTYELRVYDDAHFVLFYQLRDFEKNKTYDHYNIYDTDGKVTESYRFESGSACDDQVLMNIFRQPNGIFDIKTHVRPQFRSEYDTYASYENYRTGVYLNPLDQASEKVTLFARTEGTETWEEYFIQPYNDMYDLVTAILVEELDGETGLPVKTRYKFALRHKTEGTYTFGDYTDLRALYALGDGRLLMANADETAFYLASVGEDLSVGEPRLLAECGKNSVFAFSPDEKLFAIAVPDTTDGVVTSVTLSLYDTETAEQIVFRQIAVDASHGIEFAKTPVLSYETRPYNDFTGQLCVTQNGRVVLRLPGSTYEHVFVLEKDTEGK